MAIIQPPFLPALTSSDRRDRLRRLALNAQSSNPLINGVYPGVTVTTAAVGTAVGTQRVQYFTQGVAGRPEHLGAHGGSIVVSPSAPPYAYFPVNTTFPTVGALGAVFTNSTTQPEYYMAALSWELECVTNAIAPEIIITSATGQNVQVIIDGQYATASAITPFTGAGLIKLDFASARKPRHIRVVGRGMTSIRGFYVSAQDDVWQPSQGDVVTVACTGDSYGEAIGIASPANPDAGWPRQLGHRMGWRDVRQTAVASTGYVSTGNNGTAQGTSRVNVYDQIDRWRFVPDVIVCASGYNDVTYLLNSTSITNRWVTATIATPTMIGNAALETWRKFRAVAPLAPIFIFGPWTGRRGPDANSVLVENALAATFATWGDTNASYFPTSPIISEAPSWLHGTGYAGTTNGTGNTDYYISSDLTHPTDEGHEYLGRRMADAIRTAF